VIIENSVADEQRLASLMSSSGRISYSSANFLRFWHPKFCSNPEELKEKEALQDSLRVLSKNMQSILVAHKPAMKEYTKRILGRKGFIYEEDLLNAMKNETYNSMSEELEHAFAVHKFLFEGTEWIKDSQWALSSNGAGPYLMRPQWQLDLLMETRNALKSIDLESFRNRVKTCKRGAFKCHDRGDELILNCLRLFADDFYINAGNASLSKNPFKELVNEVFLGVAIVDSQSHARDLLNRLLGESNGTRFAIETATSRPFMNSYISNSDLLTDANIAVNASSGFKESHLKVHDFSDLPVWLIDPKGTVEVDDGISVEVIPGRPNEVILHVHVADPSEFITEAIEGEAFRRAGSLYLPEVKVPMLPSIITNMSTLKYNDTDDITTKASKSTLTFTCRVDLTNGSIHDHQIRRGFIRNLKHLTYEEADGLEGTVPQLQLIKRAYEAHLKHRQANGHVIFSFPKGSPFLDRENKRILVDLHDSVGFMKEAVAEMMIIAGRIAGEYLVEHGLAAPFRNHPGFTNSVTINNYINANNANNGPLTLLQKYELVRALPVASVDSIARRHESMGLDSYVKVTSPLRRYLDLVTHSILKEESKTKYGNTWFTQNLHEIHRQELYNKRLSSAVNRFWIEKYLWQEEQEDKERIWSLVPLERLKEGLWTVHVEQVATNFICQLNDSGIELGCPIRAKLIGNPADSLLRFERL